MKYLKTAAIILVGAHWNLALAQIEGEANEPTLEELDAAFTEADAAREAAAWTDVIVDRSNPDPLGALSTAADLVIHGTVKSQRIQYDGEGIPFTHTTIAIAEVVKGDHLAGEITLVQEGGPSRTNNDRIRMVSTAQHFNTAEEEILFLKLVPGNQRVADQIIVQHRFRIYEGQVYNEDGRGVVVESMGPGGGKRLKLSRDRHPAKRFQQIHVGSHTLNKNFGPQVGPADGSSEADSSSDSNRASARMSNLPSYTASADVATFTAAITD